MYMLEWYGSDRRCAYSVNKPWLYAVCACIVHKIEIKRMKQKTISESFKINWLKTRLKINLEKQRWRWFEEEKRSFTTTDEPFIQGRKQDTTIRDKKLKGVNCTVINKWVNYIVLFSVAAIKDCLHSIYLVFGDGEECHVVLKIRFVQYNILHIYFDYRYAWYAFDVGAA